MFRRDVILHDEVKIVLHGRCADVAGLCRAAAQQPGWLAHWRRTVAIGRAFKNPNKSIDGGRIGVRSVACFGCIGGPVLT